MTAALKLPVLKFHSKKLLSVQSLSVSFDDRLVCSEITFDVNEGEIIALSGRNGCGKTSIIRLICGDDIPHTGEVIISRCADLYISSEVSTLLNRQTVTRLLKM